MCRFEFAELIAREKYIHRENVKRGESAVARKLYSYNQTIVSFLLFFLERIDIAITILRDASFASIFEARVLSY